MRVLIAEDEFTSRRLMQGILRPYAECEAVVNGQEAVEAFEAAFGEGKPFDLVCMDIMMPVMDGQEALRRIREVEKARGIKPSAECPVIMTTALGDPKNVVSAYYRGGASAYLTKPIEVQALLGTLQDLGLLTRP